MELRTETELTQEIERLRAGFLLHDIGKVAMPDAILFKPGALTAEERALMGRHPVVGAEIVDGIEFLSNVSHFTLLEAADGVEALEVAKRHSPAIVFLDVDMPRKDGIDTLRELRADPATGDATTVILTAAHGDRIEAAAERAGADLFLTKPFSPLELLRLVDRLGGDVPA